MELLMELVLMATASQRGFISQRRLKMEGCSTSCVGLHLWTHQNCSHALYSPVDEDGVSHPPCLNGLMRKYTSKKLGGGKEELGSLGSSQKRF